MNAWASGRIENGDTRNALFRLRGRYFNQQTDKRMFYATVEGVAGHALDLDTVVDLGGDTGLRGYPLRYQTGDSKLLITIEQRYFTDWYPISPVSNWRRRICRRRARLGRQPGRGGSTKMVTRYRLWTTICIHANRIS